MKNKLGLRNSKVPTARYPVFFKGKKLILMGTKSEGGLYTEKELEDKTIGKYYLYSDGRILRKGELVGTKKDIEFL